MAASSLSQLMSPKEQSAPPSLGAYAALVLMCDAYAEHFAYQMSGICFQTS